MAGMALVLLCALGADDSGWRSTHGQPAAAGRSVVPQAQDPLQSVVRPASAESALDRSDLLGRAGQAVRDELGRTGQSIRNGLERGVDRAADSANQIGRDLLGTRSDLDSRIGPISTTQEEGPGGRMRRPTTTSNPPRPPRTGRTGLSGAAGAVPNARRRAGDGQGVGNGRAADPSRRTNGTRDSFNDWLNAGQENADALQDPFLDDEIGATGVRGRSAAAGTTNDDFRVDTPAARRPVVRPVRDRGPRTAGTSGHNYDLPLDIGTPNDLDANADMAADWGLGDSVMTRTGSSYLDDLRTPAPQMRRRNAQELADPAPRPPVNFARRAQQIRRRTVQRELDPETHYAANDSDLLYGDDDRRADGTYLNPPGRVRDDVTPVRRSQTDPVVTEVGRFPLPDGTETRRRQRETERRSPSDDLAEGVAAAGREVVEGAGDLLDGTGNAIGAAGDAIGQAGRDVKEALVARPWWPLTLTIVGLFFSISFNAYLGWTAWDLYSRYQEVVEDVHELENQLDTKRDESFLASSIGSRPARSTSALG